jgi:hypothetical protein
MTTKIPLTLTLAALIGFAAPAFAAETHAAKHDPQVATTTAKPKAAPGAKETKASPAKGRHAKSTQAKGTAKTTAQSPVVPPASK